MTNLGDGSLQGKADTPPIVDAANRFCVENGIWHRLSRNPKVLSCRDAASRRNRLGAVGITLSDELRSFAVNARKNDGGTVLALLHCRADRFFDFEKLAKIDSIEFVEDNKATLESLSDEPSGYGLVNPFTAEKVFGEVNDVIQVFDESVFDIRGSETGTMMTNAGEHTWAIEFDPIGLQGLIDSKKYLRASISTEVVDGEANEKVPSRLAIVTGNAPESGMLLWQKVNNEFKKLKGAEFKGDVSYPEVLIGSYPWMGLSMEIDVRSDHFKRRLLDEVVGLSAMGADLVAVACNTTQVYEPDISNALRQQESQFCGLAEIVRRWLVSRPQETPVFVAGIGHVTNNTEYSAFRFLHECKSVVLPSTELSEAIIDLAFEVKKFGPTSKTNQKLRSILNRSGCNHALLLLTELSMVFGEFPRIASSGVQVVDALDLYAKELAIRLFPFKSPSSL